MFDQELKLGPSGEVTVSTTHDHVKWCSFWASSEAKVTHYLRCSYKNNWRLTSNLWKNSRHLICTLEKLSSGEGFSGLSLERSVGGASDFRVKSLSPSLDALTFKYLQTFSLYSLLCGKAWVMLHKLLLCVNDHFSKCPHCETNKGIFVCSFQSS